MCCQKKQHFSSMSPWKSVRNPENFNRMCNRRNTSFWIFAFKYAIRPTLLQLLEHYQKSKPHLRLVWVATIKSYSHQRQRSTCLERWKIDVALPWDAVYCSTFSLPRPYLPRIQANVILIWYTLYLAVAFHCPWHETVKVTMNVQYPNYGVRTLLLRIGHKYA